MLSYMLPVEDKPPPAPKSHLQLSLAHQNQNGHHPNGNNNPGTQILTNGKAGNTPISKETSVSSFVSDTTATASFSSMTPTSTSTDKGKPKLTINGGKHQSLKRVSFGSSKGSMVETLIFESPLQEEPEPSPIPENGISFTNDCDKEDEREKVRVTFFQQSKPLEVDLPDDPPFSDNEFLMSSPVLKNDVNHVVYNRTERPIPRPVLPYVGSSVKLGSDKRNDSRAIGLEMDLGEETTQHLISNYVAWFISDVACNACLVATPAINNQLPDHCSTESGWDNPFRPGGDLSREADQIVELIKGGKPITPTPGSQAPSLPTVGDSPDLNHTAVVDCVDAVSPKKSTTLNAAPTNQARTNGTTDKNPSPGQLDVQRTTVKADGDGAQVEHVNIKKKNKCNCCVIS